jgi:hypothetical protein
MDSAPIEQLAIERLPYEKPILRSISLVASEVLGVSCKNESPSSGMQSQTLCTAATPCLT